MTKDSQKNSKPALNYDRVVLANIRRNRRGKHHDLIQGIFQDLETLPAGSAINFLSPRWMASRWRISDRPFIARP